MGSKCGLDDMNTVAVAANAWSDFIRGLMPGVFRRFDETSRVFTHLEGSKWKGGRIVLQDLPRRAELSGRRLSRRSCILVHCVGTQHWIFSKHHSASALLGPGTSVLQAILGSFPKPFPSVMVSCL